MRARNAERSKTLLLHVAQGLLLPDDEDNDDDDYYDQYVLFPPLLS